MKKKLLDYLACPSCAGSINIREAGEVDGIEIMSGELECDVCSTVFAMRRGVPRFADHLSLGEGKKETAENFGWSWQTFSHEDEKFGEELLGWLAPVQPEYFQGKVILEAGCGKGRHTHRIASWGARDIVAVDLSDAIDLAFDATRGMENAHVIQADIYNLPLKQAFDYAFSVGVLHHLPDPRAGFKAMTAKVKPGGAVSAWIYGAENNKWIIKVVNPVREYVTSRMNRRILFHLSKIPAAVLFTITKLFHGPMNRSRLGSAIARRTFYNDYLNFFSAFNWREQHSIVFDHLVAPTAFYIPREEFESWWDEIRAQNVIIGWHNRNSWRGFGKLNG
jgi:SAM-dependent methyltransferase/uncharacterized protein YbaR (Trm112 family)